MCFLRSPWSTPVCSCSAPGVPARPLAPSRVRLGRSSAAGQTSEETKQLPPRSEPHEGQAETLLRPGQVAARGPTQLGAGSKGLSLLSGVGIPSHTWGLNFLFLLRTHHIRQFCQLKGSFSSAWTPDPSLCLFLPVSPLSLTPQLCLPSCPGP